MYMWVHVHQTDACKHKFLVRALRCHHTYIQCVACVSMGYSAVEHVLARILRRVICGVASAACRDGGIYVRI